MKKYVMKKIVLLVFLFSSIHVQAQNEVLFIDTLSFRYVYIEFRGDYEIMADRINMFWQECQKQKLEPEILGEMLTVYLNDQDSLWRLAFPIKGIRFVQEPLRTAEIQNWQIVKKEYHGTDIRFAVMLLNFRLQEMGLYQSDYTIIRWFKDSSKKEILIPFRSIDSFESIIGRVSRFIVSLSIVLYLAFAFFLFTQRKGNRPSNMILALFLFSCAMLYIDWIADYFRYTVFVHFAHTLYIGDAFRYVIGPLIFFYVLSIVRRDFRFKKWYLIHLLPFVVVQSLWTIRFYIHSAEIKQALFLSGNIFSSTEQLLGSIIYNAQVIGYLLAAIILVHLYKREVKNQQSAVLPGQFSWLSIVLYGFLIMNYLEFLKHSVYNYFGKFSYLLFLLQILSYFIFSLVMLYYGLKHPELFSLIDFKVLRPQNPSLSQKVFNEYKTILMQYMEKQKPYLIPELTINKLSELVEIPVRSLSTVINKGFNQNFFEFINTYRIQEAKKLMTGSHKHRTVLEIIYEVGYNNKSVFNAVFKKYTGKTPKKYRAELLN
jgi:AraC-like DNA-binding protein